MQGLGVLVQDRPVLQTDVYTVGVEASEVTEVPECIYRSATPPRAVTPGLKF